MISSSQSVVTVSTVASSSASTTNSRYSHKSTPATKFPKKVFVYISPCTTQVGLRQVFEEYGQVNYVRILTDQEGCSRGMAFVGFRWSEDAAAAIEGLNGRVLDKMILRPSWASPPRKQTSDQQTTKRKTARNRSHRHTKQGT